MHRIKLIARACLLTFAILAPMSASAQNDKDIRVEVVSGVTGYMIVFLDNECPEDWQEDMGCIYQRRGNSGLIRWRLSDASLEQGWQLEAVYLSTVEKGTGVDGHAQSSCISGDFNMTGSDLSSGYVSSAKPHGGGRFLDVFNNNRCGSDYYVHYRLTAVNPGINENAESDPIISNGGRR